MPWLAQHLWLVGAIIGHLALVILAVNVAHGMGVHSRWLDAATIAWMIVFGLGVLWIGLPYSALPGWAWPHWLRWYSVLCLIIAFVGLPAASIRRHQLSRNVPFRSQSSRIPLLHHDCPSRYIGTSHRGFLLRLPGNESLAPEWVEWDVPIPGGMGIPDGFRILHLSDLHFSLAYRQCFFEELIEQAKRWPCDLVVISGDIVDDSVCLGWIKTLLSDLKGRWGQFAVVGNHDHAHQLVEVIHALESAGFTVLDGTDAVLNVNGARLQIAGTCAPWGPDLEPVCRDRSGDFRILISHTPDELYRAAKRGFDLVLAGHNHGGQAVVPVLGPILMPSRYSRRFERGFYREGKTLLYASRGLGSKHPLRWGCRPELTGIILRSDGTTIAP
jgi:predicted MPP superfamily phosphohydrolase